MITCSSDIDIMILACLSFPEFVRYFVPVCKRWNDRYKRLSHPKIIPRGLHGLSIHDFNTQTSTEILSYDITSLRYLKLANVIIPPLPFLECLDLDVKSLSVQDDLTHINSQSYPRLNHLILRRPELKTLGELNLDTLTLYTDIFRSIYDYKKVIGTTHKLRIYGCIWLYTTASTYIRDVEIHTPINDLDFHCTREISRVVINVNPKMPHGQRIYEDNIRLLGDVSQLSSLIIVGKNVTTIPPRSRLCNLKVFKVSPNLLEQFKAEFPFVEVAKSCGGCGIILKETRRCGKCCRVYYCSRQCQVNQWHIHKLECVT